MNSTYYSLIAVSIAAIQLLCPGFASARVYQTDDAIIMEDDEYAARLHGDQLNKHDVRFKLAHPFLFADTHSIVRPSEFREKTNAMPQSLCFTREGKLGSCTSLRSCYPNSESSAPNPLTWDMISKRSTCRYVGNGGKQEDGVCCSMRTIDGNDAVTGGGRRTIPVVTLYDRYHSLVQPNLMASWLSYYYPYWRVVVSTNPMATSKSVPVSQTASGQGETKQSSCGAGPAKALSLDDQRIVGGNNAIKNSWPGIVALKLNGRFLCGGSLISRDKILTAAHCVSFWSMIFPRLSGLSVELGLHTVNPTSDAQVTRRVTRVARHLGFNSNTFRNDIAILTMDSPVTFTSSISPVCLPSPGANDTYVNQTAAIIGWGSTQRDGKKASVLQQAAVRILDNSQCKKQYQGENDIVDHMLCAAAPNTDSCQGDSGGPLLVQAAPESPWVQAAIVSYGIGCADQRYPGVYTRVTSFLPWIRRYM
ncbi:transmembrane protease serine 11D-like [Daphnia carinata]|uniref:transmembrane protease serine 11D-like n=1 Tax=Daphnia carinata TaxID=120202 RepID=UPI0028686A38|nr:transmembrane protease serine 11D-like [Daphnia carinata]